MNFPKFLNKSINTRVVVLVGSLLVSSMIIITLFSVFIIYMSMSKQTSVLLENRVNFIQKRIEQRLSYSIEDTEKLTKNELMVNSLTDADGREEYLPALVKNFMLGKNVVSLNIVDFDGKPIFKTQENIPLYNESENLRSALAMGNTDFYIEEDSGEFVVVSPIEYYGTTQGAAIVVFNLPKIIDNNFPDRKYMYIALVKNEKKLFSRNFVEGDSYQVSRANIKSNTSIFNQLGLSLEVGMDSEVYVSPVRDVIYKLLLLSILLVFIGALLARLLAKSITNPILELYKRVTSPHVSGTSFCSPLDTEDEVEELAKAFDKRTLMLQHQAQHDALTSLPNRVLFIDRVKENIKQSRENSSNFAVFFLDLDHFKEVNDSFGHKFGDELLLIVGEYLEAVLSERDSVARMGGDEFTILLSDIKNINSVIPVLEKVMKLFQEPFHIHDEKFYVTCSIGVSVYPVHGDTSELLLKNADAAMHKAKEEGRNTYKFYTDDMTKKAYERILLEKELREAIRNREFEVYYQPQVNMETTQIIGMEALVRWRHPIQGLVSPAKFIPLAEETGLIVEIDKQVTRDAMFQFQKWIEDGYDVGTLSINLSMLQLNYDGFLGFVRDTLKLTNIATENVMFEVTETQVMKNPENAIMIFNQLKALGIRLAVDDFGTGHSSLSYLKRLPIDKLKIDQSFTRDVMIDKNDAELTRAIISIAKSLHLDIIAEGVETYEQRTFLLENGCLEAQGYFYYKPQSTEEITKILAGM